MILTEDRLKMFKHCFPLGTIRVLKNNCIELLRHPQAATLEVYKHWKNIASLITVIETSWKKYKDNISIHGAEIITNREHYYGRYTNLKFVCLSTDCGYVWEGTYANLSAQIYKWEKLDYPTEEQKTHIACPECRKLISKANTQKYKFGAMNNQELFIAAIGVPTKNLKSNGTFRGKHSVLSNEMNARKVCGKSLLELFSQDQGWRLIRPELTSYSYNDWYDYLELRGYKTVDEWKKDDPRAQCICSSSHKNTYYTDLKNEFFNKERLTLDSIQYDSTSELLVAKVLSHLNISFIPHGKWGFFYKKLDSANKKRKRRHPEYDFKFSIQEKKYIVEVWLCSKDSLKLNEMKDEMLLDYLNKRNFKTENAPIYHPDVTLVSIEASINRKNGQKAFLEHVKEVLLTEVGLSDVCEIDFESLYEGDPRPLSQWRVCDFFRECREINAKQITDLSTSLQNILRKNVDIKIALAQLLARKHGYPLNTRYYLAPLSHVIEYCSKRPELGVRKVYQKRHSSGKLPHGFPQRVTNTYGEITTHGEICGVKPVSFLGYSSAKKLAQKYAFNSSVEYEYARSSDNDKFEPLKRIYKLPDHPISGYAEWEDWSTFLGNKKLWKLTPEGDIAISVLKGGSVKKTASYIRHTLGCQQKSELREISADAVKALKMNPNSRNIEIVAFGRTINLMFDFETVAKTVKLEDLLTEKIWREKRAKHKTYQRILAKFYLKWPEYKGEWKNILKLLEAYNNQ